MPFMGKAERPRYTGYQVLKLKLSHEWFPLWMWANFRLNPTLFWFWL
jgi:hypothetical protein